MEIGGFYASTGVEIKVVTFSNNKLAVAVDQEVGVDYKITFIGCKKGNIESEELLSTKGNKTTFKLTNDLLFDIPKITSSKLHENPIEDLRYETARTQLVSAVVINRPYCIRNN